MKTFVLTYDALATVHIPVEASSAEEAVDLFLRDLAGSKRQVELEAMRGNPISVCLNTGQFVKSIGFSDEEQRDRQEDGLIYIPTPPFEETGWTDITSCEALVERVSAAIGLRRDKPRGILRKLVDMLW